MKSDLNIISVNETYLRLDAEPHILKELNELFTFDVPGAKFSPAYRKKHWDGKIRLLKRNHIYRGLYSLLLDFCKENSYAWTSDVVENDFSKENVSKFLSSLNLSDENENSITLRDYQERIVTECITHNRRTILSPTGSGKSAAIYAILRFYLSQIEGRILILVPNISLVNQLYSDFIDYSKLNHFDVESNCTKIYYGQEKENKRITISTWQSQMTATKEDLSKYEMIIFDETHYVKAKEITTILEKTINARYRFGFTGTLDNDKCNELIIQGLLGNIFNASSTNELIENDILNTFRIQCILLNYSDTIKKKSRSNSYQDEIAQLVSDEKRNKFICSLTSSLSGATLLLFSRVEAHGRILYEEIKKKNPTRNVYFVYGDTKGHIREEIRKNVEDDSNAIIVASSQIFSTGINIRSLQNIIFAHPSKSRIRILQSIGRMLRKKKNKGMSVLYDIADDLRLNNKTNYSYRHFVERVKLYSTESFSYKISSYNLYK